MWNHNNSSPKIQLLNEVIIQTVCQVPGQHHYTIHDSTSPGILYHDLLHASKMEEKNMLCEPILLQKTIQIVKPMLDQELHWLETFDQSIFDFEKKYDYLYWREKIYSIFLKHCSAHCKNDIILSSHEPCSSDDCKAQLMLFNGIEHVSDDFRLQFTYENISKHISFLVSFKEIPHLDQLRLHILKAALPSLIRRW